jgi:hypothetical protein
MAGPDGLVIGAVLIIRRPLGRDIGRQRHDPGFGQSRIKRLTRLIESQRQVSFRLRDHICEQMFGKADRFANIDLAQRFGQGTPTQGPRLKQGHLNLCDCLYPLPVTEQTCGNDAGIVQDQPITSPQDIRQIADPPVADPVAIRQQQPRRCPGPCRSRRNQRFGKVKVEIGKLHSVTSLRFGGACRKISRNMPGVRTDSGFTDTIGSSTVPVRP